MKKILVLYYTQSGQLKRILDFLTKPLIEAGHEVHFEEIKPLVKYPFPWNGFKFFNAFPETFTQKPIELEPLSAKAFDQYDLIVLGYTPWFLSPSRPVSGLLQSEEGKKIFNGKNVITILGCRNMWLSAQEKLKQKLIDAKAKLVGHIALIDKSSNVTSLITILRWMLTGKKEAFWFFPSAGVAENDVQDTVVFGKEINEVLVSNNYQDLQTKLLSKGAIDIKPNLVLMERRGRKSFSVWSKFVASGGDVNSTGRKIRVRAFMILLPTMIIILTPLLWTLSTIMLIAKRKHLLEEIEYYKQTSLR